MYTDTVTPSFGPSQRPTWLMVFHTFGCRVSCPFQQGAVQQVDEEYEEQRRARTHRPVPRAAAAGLLSASFRVPVSRVPRVWGR